MSLLLAHHRRTLAYDDWANAATLASLVAWRAAPRHASSRARKLRPNLLPARRARLLLAHVVAAERLWIARIRSERPPLAVWPDLSLDDCDEQLLTVAQAWHHLCASWRPRDLERTIVYVNSQGERWQSTIGDIVTHVVVHSAYHRGQIAALARGEAMEPAYTDYIHCTRTAAIEPLAAVTALRATKTGARAARSARATPPRARSRRTTPSRRS